MTVRAFEDYTVHSEHEVYPSLNPLAQQLRIKLKAAAYTIGGEDWVRLFSRADADRNGQLDLDEFRALIRTEGRLSRHLFSDALVRQLFEAVDVDRSRTVALQEFLDWFRDGVFKSPSRATRTSPLTVLRDSRDQPLTVTPFQLDDEPEKPESPTGKSEESQSTGGPARQIEETLITPPVEMTHDHVSSSPVLPVVDKIVHVDMAIEEPIQPPVTRELKQGSLTSSSLSAHDHVEEAEDRKDLDVHVNESSDDSSDDSLLNDIDEGIDDLSSDMSDDDDDDDDSDSD